MTDGRSYYVLRKVRRAIEEKLRADASNGFVTEKNLIGNNQRRYCKDDLRYFTFCEFVTTKVKSKDRRRQVAKNYHKVEF